MLVSESVSVSAPTPTRTFLRLFITDIFIIYLENCLLTLDLLITGTGATLTFFYKISSSLWENSKDPVPES